MIPKILWQGTCPMIGIVAQKDWLYRCVEVSTEAGAGRDPQYNTLIVEQQSPDAMGHFRWETVTFGPVRNYVLEYALMHPEGRTSAPFGTPMPHP